MTTADRIWVTLDFMEASRIPGYTGMDTAVPTGSGPAGRRRDLPVGPGPLHARPSRSASSTPAAAAPLGGGGSLAVKIGGVGQVPGDAVGVVVNVTATGGSGAGYLTVYPCGASPPTASNVNFVAGSSVPNLVTAALGSGGQLCVFANVTTHVIVDLAGWYRANAGAAFTPQSPQRVLDSRGGAIGQSYSLSLAGLVPGDAVAVAVNLTATQPGAAGYLTAYPCGGAVPLVSNVNFGAGQTVPNSAVVPIGANRSICFFANTPDPHHRRPGRRLRRRRAPRSRPSCRAACSTPATARAVGWAPSATPRRSTSPWAARPGCRPAPPPSCSTSPSPTPNGPGYLTVYPCGGTVPRGVEPELHRRRDPGQPRHRAARHRRQGVLLQLRAGVGHRRHHGVPDVITGRISLIDPRSTASATSS